MTTNPTAPQDGGEKLANAKRWMGALPRDQFNFLLLLTNDAHARGRNEGLDEARWAAHCAIVDVGFGPEDRKAPCHYSEAATDAIRALQQKGPSNG